MAVPAERSAQICARCNALLLSRTIQALEIAEGDTSTLLYIFHVGTIGHSLSFIGTQPARRGELTGWTNHAMFVAQSSADTRETAREQRATEARVMKVGGLLFNTITREMPAQEVSRSWPRIETAHVL